MTKTPNYYEPLGLATVQWAAIEQSLDVLIHLVFTFHNGKEIEAVVPVALKRKIDFLRRSFRRIEALVPHKDVAIGYFERVIALSDKRHDLVHGFSVQLTGTTGPIEIQRILYKGTHHEMAKKTITLADLMALIADSRALFEDLMGLTMQVAAPFAGGSLKNSDG